MEYDYQLIVVVDINNKVCYYRHSRSVGVVVISLGFHPRDDGFDPRTDYNAISTEYCGLCLNNVDAGMLHKGHIDLAVRVSDSKMWYVD